MMKLLSGAELAGYLKERQSKEVRRLKHLDVSPLLAIVSEGRREVNEVYLKLKAAYGRDIGAEVRAVNTSQPTESIAAVLKLNDDENVHGIVVQLPLSQPDRTDDVVNLIEPAKDIDGLGKDAGFDSATATAITWLMAAYGIDLAGKKIAIIGQGRLVGKPLSRLLKSSGLEPLLMDENTLDLVAEVKDSDVIISAAGHPGLLEEKMVKSGAVVVDAGSASDEGVIKGDADPKLYERDDITITPKLGGVGPLTVAVLFDNLIRALRAKVGPS